MTALDEFGRHGAQTGHPLAAMALKLAVDVEI
jgi:hypothetical protein